MTIKFSLISSIRPGKSDWKLKVRVLRLWYVAEFKNPNERNSIEMIILDEKSEKIGVVVKKKYFYSFEKLLHEGAVYILQNLVVALNDTKFPTTKHRFKLHFIDATGCVRVEGTEIPKYHFDFMPFSDILAATNDDKLLDIIGQVVESNIKNTETNGVKKKLLDVVIQDLQMKSIHCTLWGEYAEQMQKYLEKRDGQPPVIIVLQLCKMKKICGEMGVTNAYFGTRIYLDPGLEVIKEYRKKMEDSQLLLPAVNQLSSKTIVSDSDEFLQMERKTILDLIEASEAGFGSVLAQVVEVESENGWFYQSCFNCSQKVFLLNSKLHCSNCHKNVCGFPRYMAHLKVIDNSASASFVLFDGIVEEYIGKEATKFVKRSYKEIKLSDMPPTPLEFQNFVGKQFLFKVQINDFNIYEPRQSYNVKKISEDKELINKFITLHNIKFCNVEEETDYMDTLNNIAEENPLIVLEGGDSSWKSSVGFSYVEQALTCKLSRKRTNEEMYLLSDYFLEF